MPLATKKSTLSLAIAGAITLTGCGSSGGSSESGFNVTAIDGYLENAVVCHDENLNDTCDAGEELGRTNAQGQLALNARYRNLPLIIKAIANETVDSDTGLLTENFELTAPIGTEYITPFAHLAAQQNKTLAEVADDFDLDETVINGDFLRDKQNSDATIADSAQIVHSLARFIVNAMIDTPLDNTTAIQDLNTAITQVKLQAEHDQENGRDPSERDYEYDANLDNVSSAPALLGNFSAELLQNHSSWRMFSLNAGGNQQNTASFNTELQQLCVASGLSGQEPIGLPVFSPNSLSGCYTYSIADDGSLDLSIPQIIALNEAGALTLLDDETNWQILYDGEDDGVITMVVLANNGDLYWLDNADASLSARTGWTSQEIVGTSYLLHDDNLSRFNIDVMTSQESWDTDRYTFTDLADAQNTVSGSWSLSEA